MRRFFIILTVLFGSYHLLSAQEENVSREVSDSIPHVSDLGELVVTANSVINSGLSTIVYPSKNEVKSSENSISLLSKMPFSGLVVDPISRKIMVENGEPIILINSQQTTIEELLAISPSDISKIEYSRFTPAKYADTNAKGLLSITLKKKSDGFAVNAMVESAVNTVYLNAAINMSYNKGASGFSIFYTPSWTNFRKIDYFSSQKYISKELNIAITERGNSPMRDLANPLKLKYDFVPNNTTHFSAALTFNPISSKIGIYGHANDTYVGENDFKKRVCSSDINPGLDLYFRKDITPGDVIEWQEVVTYTKSRYNNDWHYIYQEGRDDFDNKVKSNRVSLISELSYKHLFPYGASFSTGYQNTLSKNENIYIGENYTPSLSENNNYLYAKYEQQWNRVAFSASTGIKAFWEKNDLVSRRYIANISSLQFQWSLNSHWSLGISFRYTPEIPSLNAITDFPQQISPYLWANGNPDIKISPVFRYSFNANYNYRKFNISYNSVLYDVSPFFLQDVEYIGENRFLMRVVNCERARNWINNFNLTLSDIYGFGANLSVGVEYYDSKGENWEYNILGVPINFSVWWNHGPFTISYFRNIPAKWLQGNVVYKDRNSDGLKFAYTPNSHWSFSVGWLYMFEKRGAKVRQENLSKVNPGKTLRDIRNMGNMVTLSVGYNFKTGKDYNSINRNLENKDSGSAILKTY